MSHYYSRDNDLLESKPKEFECVVAGNRYRFLTDRGVFSRDGLDFGSRLLLETLIPDVSGRILDLGCGYGPIGIALAKSCNAEVVMADVNRRAIELAKRNSGLNKVSVDVRLSDGLSEVEGDFDYIVTNPPIRAGKAVYYSWFKEAKERLRSDGKLVFVMRKDQGALSAIAHCKDLYGKADVIAKKSGYFIVLCQKCLTI
ncbi:MAG: class I SAM-dependent methyltransferase [Bacilli bacterium]|nr:class I SAM-dependent methyltransferase [Bacilli bacterium]MBN2696301.1 class I SAM-dependent methyltransferase [Bacilli bacterium]